MEAMLFFLLQIEILVWHITTTALPPGIVALLPFIIFFFCFSILVAMVMLPYYSAQLVFEVIRLPLFFLKSV